MARHKSPKPTYAERLQQELDGIALEFDTIIADSGIEYVNPNRHGSGIASLGAADWGWKDSPAELEVARMSLLGRVRGWQPVWADANHWQQRAELRTKTQAPRCHYLQRSHCPGLVLNP
jgi:hypothetical protein